MKNLLIVAFILIGNTLFSQCDKNTAFVFSIAPGYSKTGFVFNMEAGLWPMAGRVGVLAGPILYSRQQTNMIKGEVETITDFDLAGRLVFKLTTLGENNPQLITMFGTVRGNMGASYRAYLSIGRYDIMGIEPFYGSKTGIGVNLIYTTRL